MKSKPLFLTVFFVILFAATIHGQCVSPVISSFSPLSGAAGQTITINGSNFNSTPASNTVFFGSAKATVITATANQLTVTMPVGATYNHITVTNSSCSLTGYSPLYFNPISVCPGTFTATSVDTRIDYTSPDPQYGPYGILFGDFDLDGKTDVMYPTGFGTTSGIVITRNQSVPGIIDLSSAITITTGASQARNAAVADFDGDGKLDIVFVNNTGAQISVIKNTSSGPGNFSFAPALVLTVSSSPYQVAADDIDGDGKPEIGIAHTGSNNVSVFRNTSTTGSVSFAARQDFNVSTPQYAVGFADFNGDNKIELVATATGGGLRILGNTSTIGTISFSAFLTVNGATGYRLAIGDLNSDGYNDVVVASISGNGVGAFRNTSSGGVTSFAAGTILNTTTSNHRVAISDLNGDGKPDISTSYSGNSYASCLINTTASPGDLISVAAPITLTTTGCTYALGTADIDGDGNNDVLTGDWCTNRKLNVFRNNLLSSIPIANSVSPTSGLTCNSTITINYFAQCNGANPGNIYTAQLSDANGSFSVPVNIGSVASIVSGTITGTIPACIATGTGYRVRVVGSDPATTGTVYGTPLSIVCQTITPASISTLAINPTTYCAGATLNVGYTATGSFGVCATNTFTAQLSDASGSFASPINIGSLISNISGTIAATIPNNLPSGASYRIRVVSSQPQIVGTNNGTNILISQPPVATITPSGPTTLCSGNSVTLTASPGASWLWSTNQTTQQITVNQTGNFSVTITNAGGCSASANIDILATTPIVVTAVTSNNATGPVAPQAMIFSGAGQNVTFVGQGPGAKQTGGRTNIYSNINTSLYGGMWWTFTPIENPRHSSQGATGQMVFNSYDPVTRIITFTSTANMIWQSVNHTENIATRLRMQLQPYTGTHTGPIATGLPFVTAGDISLGSLPANYPLIDIKALGSPAAYQVWYIIETASGVPLDVYYGDPAHNSSVGGITVTSQTGSFFSSALSTCNGGPATVTVTATGGTGPYIGTGVFSAAIGEHTYTVTDANGCSGSATIDVEGQNCIELQCVENKIVSTDAGSCVATVMNIDPIITPPNAIVNYKIEKGGIELETGVGSVSGKTFTKGITTVTYTAADEPTKTCSFTVTVNDTEKPIVTKGSIGSCYSSVAAAEAAALEATIYSDNCTPNAQLNVNVATVGTCSAVITVTVTDATNNSNSVTYNTRVDNTAPVLSLTPPSVTVNCQSVPGVPAVTASDNCDGSVSVTFTPSSTQGVNPAQSNYYNYTITRKWFATDGCGNTVAHVQTITVQDVTAPSLTCPANIVVSNETGLCSAHVTFNATSSDLCSTPTVKYYLYYGTAEQQEISSPWTFTVGSYTVKVVSTDPSGNSNNCTFTITIEDHEPPVFGGSNNANGDVVYLRSNTSAPWGLSGNETAMNAVFGIGGWLDRRFETVNTATLFSAATKLIFMEGGDGTANELKAFILANKVPMEAWVNNGGRLLLNAAPNEGGNIDFGFGGVTLVYPNYTQTGVATVPGHPIFNGPLTPVGTSWLGSYFGHAILTPVGQGMVKLIHSSENNLALLVEAQWGNGIVMFGGMTLPFFQSNLGSTWPQPTTGNLHKNILSYLSGAGINQGNMNVSASANQCGANISYSTPQATDNCPGVTIIQSTGLASGSFFPVGNTINKFVATDAAGNTASYSFSVTVNDNQSPTFNCPANQNVNLNSSCQLIIPDLVSGLTGSDNCGTVTFTQSPLAGASFASSNNQTYNVVITASDGHGNTQTCTVILTGKDVTKPTVTAPTTVDLECSGNLPAPATTITQFLDLAGSEADDNCTAQAALLVSSSDGPLVNGNCNGTITRTYTITDAAGNSTSVNHVFTITDNTKPTATGPTTVDLECRSDLPAAKTTILDFLSLLGANANDNCTPQANLLVSSVDGPLVGSNCSGTITRKYTITDACNNITTVDHVFTVTDNTIPVINTCPGNGVTFIKNTNAGVCTYRVVGTEFDATGSDNCTGVTMSYSIVNEHNPGTVTGTGSLAGKYLSFGLNTITWVATDGCGNTSVACCVKVDVDKITTTTTLTVSPTSQQYSDLVTFTATVTPNNCTGAGNIGGTVTFKIGSLIIGTAPVINGIATVTDTLIEDMLYDANLNDPMNPTNGPLKPGAKTVTAYFSGTDGDYLVTNPTAPLTVTCENADITYNGQTYFSVSPNTNAGTVVLSNYVVDKNDTPTGARGDIRNATATFWQNAINGSVLGTANVPVGLVNPTNKQEGFVTTSFNDVLSNTDISNGGKVYEVWSGLNNYYCENSDTYTPVTLGLPGQDFVTGGGYIVFGNNSAGTYAGTAGKRMNFGFVMKWNSSGKNLQGRVNVVYRKMVNGVQRIYQIKSNAINSLVVENVNDAGAPATGANIKFRRATISTKANLADITDPLNPISLGGNLSLTLIGWESTTVTTGALDRINVQLSGTGSIGLLFSSNWVSGNTSWQTLNGGKIQVRNPATPAPGQRTTASEEIITKTSKLHLLIKAFPNPSDNYFNLLVEGNRQEDVVVTVYNVSGVRVHLVKGNANRYYKFGEAWIPGTYLVEVRQGNELKTLKLVKQ